MFDNCQDIVRLGLCSKDMFFGKWCLVGTWKFADVVQLPCEQVVFWLASTVFLKALVGGVKWVVFEVCPVPLVKFGDGLFVFFAELVVGSCHLWSFLGSERHSLVELSHEGKVKQSVI